MKSLLQSFSTASDSQQIIWILNYIKNINLTKISSNIHYNPTTSSSSSTSTSGSNSGSDGMDQSPWALHDAISHLQIIQTFISLQHTLSLASIDKTQGVDMNTLHSNYARGKQTLFTLMGSHACMQLSPQTRNTTMNDNRATELEDKLTVKLPSNLTTTTYNVEPTVKVAIRQNYDDVTIWRSKLQDYLISYSIDIMLSISLLCNDNEFINNIIRKKMNIALIKNLWIQDYYHYYNDSSNNRASLLDTSIPLMERYRQSLHSTTTAIDSSATTSDVDRDSFSVIQWLDGCTPVTCNYLLTGILRQYNQLLQSSHTNTNRDDSCDSDTTITDSDRDSDVTCNEFEIILIDILHYIIHNNLPLFDRLGYSFIDIVHRYPNVMERRMRENTKLQEVYEYLSTRYPVKDENDDGDTSVPPLIEKRSIEDISLFHTELLQWMLIDEDNDNATTTITTIKRDLSREIGIAPFPMTMNDIREEDESTLFAWFPRPIVKKALPTSSRVIAPPVAAASSSTPMFKGFSQPLKKAAKVPVAPPKQKEAVTHSIEEDNSYTVLAATRVNLKILEILFAKNRITSLSYHPSLIALMVQLAYGISFRVDEV